MCKKHCKKQCFLASWNSEADLPDLPEMGHGWQSWTPTTRAGGQDDVSYNKLPQIINHIHNKKKNNNKNLNNNTTTNNNN